jgi:hypothetical protein
MILEHGRIKRGRERRVLNEGLPCIEEVLLLMAFAVNFAAWGCLRNESRRTTVACLRFCNEL